MTEQQRTDLEMHNCAMDSETACLLHKVDGVLALVREAMNGCGIGEPVPDGVDSAIWAAHDILADAMTRGGLK